MTPAVKAAIISEVGSVVYIALWLVAMQWLYCEFTGHPEKAWTVRAWTWWKARAERRWALTVSIYKSEKHAPGDGLKEPPIDLEPA